MKITKNDIGKTVYHLLYGEGVIEDYYAGATFPVKVSFSSEHFNTFTANGFSLLNHSRPSIYWQPIEFDEPPKPKEKVTKTIEKWINVYEDGGLGEAHNSVKKAEDDCNVRRSRIACVKLTGTYEVEVDDE